LHFAGFHNFKEREIAERYPCLLRGRVDISRAGEEGETSMHIAELNGWMKYFLDDLPENGSNAEAD
jgi:hypothetical protein